MAYQFYKIEVRNPFLSSLVVTIVVYLLFIIISLVFTYFPKLLFWRPYEFSLKGTDYV